MIFAFFGLMLIALALYFKQIEHKWDYILIGLSIFPFLLQGILLLNDTFYSQLAFQKVITCNTEYTYLPVTNLINTTTQTCTESNVLNTNATAFTFSALDYYSLKTFDMQFIKLAHIFLFIVLIVGLLYTAYKALAAFGYIR